MAAVCRQELCHRVRLHSGTAGCLLSPLCCAYGRGCARVHRIHEHPLAPVTLSNARRSCMRTPQRAQAQNPHTAPARAACVGSGAALLLFAEHDEAEVRVVRRCVRVLGGCAHQTARRLQQLAALHPLHSVAQLIMLGAVIVVARFTIGAALQPLRSAAHCLPGAIHGTYEDGEFSGVASLQAALSGAKAADALRDVAEEVLPRQCGRTALHTPVLRAEMRRWASRVGSGTACTVGVWVYSLHPTAGRCVPERDGADALGRRRHGRAEERSRHSCVRRRRRLQLPVTACNGL